MQYLELDKNVRRMAITLGDNDVLARIAGGDLIAIEAQYHYNCLSRFKSRYRSVMRKEPGETRCSNDEKIVQSRVFAELISFIEDNIDGGTFMFKLTKLHALYQERLAVLGIEKTVNKSRLKDQLLAHFDEDCQEQTVLNSTFLVFNEGLL